MFPCKNGYYLPDGSQNGSITCNKDGKWIQKSQCKSACPVQNLTTLPGYENDDGDEQYYLNGKSALFNCSAGFLKLGNGSAYCDNGNWKSNGTCTVIKPAEEIKPNLTTIATSTSPFEGSKKLTAEQELIAYCVGGGFGFVLLVVSTLCIVLICKRKGYCREKPPRDDTRVSEETTGPTPRALNGRAPRRSVRTAYEEVDMDVVTHNGVNGGSSVRRPSDRHNGIEQDYSDIDEVRAAPANGNVYSTNPTKPAGAIATPNPEEPVYAQINKSQRGRSRPTANQGLRQQQPPPVSLISNDLYESTGPNAPPAVPPVNNDLYGSAGDTNPNLVVSFVDNDLYGSSGDGLSPSSVQLVGNDLYGTGTSAESESAQLIKQPKKARGRRRDPPAEPEYGNMQQNNGCYENANGDGENLYDEAESVIPGEEIRVFLIRDTDNSLTQVKSGLIHP